MSTGEGTAPCCQSHISNGEQGTVVDALETRDAGKSVWEDCYLRNIVGFVAPGLRKSSQGLLADQVLLNAHSQAHKHTAKLGHESGLACSAVHLLTRQRNSMFSADPDKWLLCPPCASGHAVHYPGISNRRGPDLTQVFQGQDHVTCDFPSVQGLSPAV